MDSLISYVEEQLAKGYNEAQIRQALTTYPKSMVDAAFKAANPQSSSNQVLTDYLKQYLAQGYSLEQLTSHLLTQGYSQEQISQATNNLNKKKTKLPILQILLFLFLVLIIVVGFILFLNNGNQKITNPNTTGTISNSSFLSSSSTLDNDKLYPRQELVVDSLIINKGSSNPDLTISYEIYNQYDKKIYLDIPQEKKQLKTNLDIKKTIELPGELPLGNYKLKITIYYDEDSVQNILFFDLIKESSKKEQEQKTYNESKQSYFKPQIVIINEENEDENMQEVISELKNNNGDKAEEKCLLISNQVKKDNCLSTLAVYDNKPEHCEKISSDIEHDNCLMSIMMAKGYGDCEKFNLEDKKKLCNRLKSLSELSKSQETKPQESIEEPNISDFTN